MKINIKTLILIYFLLINLFSFSIMGIDKYKAKKNKWRIKEKTLFISSLIGGGLGAYYGMNKFRHKTKKNIFKIGIPLICILNILCIIYLFKIL